MTRFYLENFGWGGGGGAGCTHPPITSYIRHTHSPLSVPSGIFVCRVHIARLGTEQEWSLQPDHWQRYGLNGRGPYKLCSSTL